MRRRQTRKPRGIQNEANKEANGNARATNRKTHRPEGNQNDIKRKPKRTEPLSLVSASGAIPQKWPLVIIIEYV